MSRLELLRSRNLTLRQCWYKAWAVIFFLLDAKNVFWVVAMYVVPVATCVGILSLFVLSVINFLKWLKKVRVARGSLKGGIVRAIGLYFLGRLMKWAEQRKESRVCAVRWFAKGLL